MRIISPFRDYYDGVQSQGFDDKIIYERRTRTADVVGVFPGGRWPERTRPDIDRDAAEVALLPDFHRRRPELYEKTPRGCWAEPAMAGLLCLAGRAYPFWQLNADDGRLEVSSLEPGFDEVVEQTERVRRGRWSKDEDIDYTPWRDWLADHWGRPIDPRIHFMHRSPLVLYLDSYRTVDPCLRDFGFQRALDPYTVFQEIDMFLGGVMAEQHDAPSPQTDKEKIASHGMDVKRSFRNMPRG
jgi:hypothetical protein